MYEYILETKLVTLLVAVAVVCVTGILVGNLRDALRSIAYSFGPSFACAFFAVGFFYGGEISTFDLTAGFLFEFSVLLAFTKLFCGLRKHTGGADSLYVEKWLRISLVLLLLVSFPIAMSEGFGLFSEGSRIAFLENSGIAKFLVYAGFLILAIQGGLVAQRLSAGQSLGATGYAVAISVFSISTISGSKGFFFLWLASILSMIDYRHVRIRFMPVIGGLIAVTVAFAISVNISSESLGLSGIEFAELVAARFFLNNDARALAFDYGGSTQQFSELLVESFRFLSVRLGYEPTDPPIGFLLHERLFGVSTGTGANASLMALITYYSIRGFALIPVFVACLGLALVYASIVGVRRMLFCPLRQRAVLIIGLTLVQSYSQDFLAFPLLVSLACVVVVLFLIAERKHACGSHR